jgi:hypothetical protein
MNQTEINQTGTASASEATEYLYQGIWYRGCVVNYERTRTVTGTYGPTFKRICELSPGDTIVSPDLGHDTIASHSHECGYVIVQFTNGDHLEVPESQLFEVVATS